MMPFTIVEATPNDARAIATILAADNMSVLTQMQFGASPEKRGETIDTMTPMFAQHIGKANAYYVLAKKEDGTVVAFAQWKIVEAMDEEEEQRKEERMRKQDQAMYNELPDGTNIPLVLECRDNSSAMRRAAVGRRRHWFLGNLGTLPAFQRQGAATQLVTWAFPQVEKEGSFVFLTTNLDGPGRFLYEKLGFREVGRSTVDLSKHGGEGTHTTIAMLKDFHDDCIDL